MNDLHRDRPRILMIGSYPKSPELINGGVAAALMYLSEALVAAGRIELVGIRIAKDNADTCDSSSFNWEVKDIPLGRGSLSTLYVTQQKRLGALIREYEPDIVHAQGADIAGYMAVRCGKPAVVTVHGLLAECAKFQTNPVEKLRASLAALVTEKGTIRRSRHIIAISPYVSQYYKNEIAGTVHDVPNAVSDAYFRIRPRLQPGRFLYAGRISNGKGLVELLDAYAQCRSPHWNLILAGATPDPSYRRLLDDRVGTLGITGSVRFAGLLNEDALIEEFSMAQSLILPSHQETAPMVVQQGMAAGLPVIASNVGGIPFQVEHGKTGLTFEAGNVVQLAELMRGIERQPDWASRLGAEARSEAKRRFHADAVADATVAVYEGMLSSSPPGESTRELRN